MRVVWKLGEVFARRIQENLSRDRHYNSVMTIIRVLERKNHLMHREDGRVHIYRAAVKPEKTRTRVLKHLVEHVFDGSAAFLVLNLVETGYLTFEELDAIRKEARPR